MQKKKKKKMFDYFKDSVFYKTYYYKTHPITCHSTLLHHKDSEQSKFMDL